MASTAQLRPSLPLIAPGDLHVWRVDLGPAVAVPADSRFLSSEERARAARFSRQQDRARFIASRLALRELLSRYVGAGPAALRFTAGPHGKLAVAPPFAAGAPGFNLAHSGHLILFAFATCDVGVDVEEVQPGVEVEELARRFFSADEREALASAPASERVRLFFRIWTRKEAFLKAHGSGLSSPLPAFTTTSVSGAPLPFILSAGNLQPGFLSDLEPAAGYAGAVVTAEPTRVVLLDLAEVPA